MKRILSSILFVVLTLGVVGCKNKRISYTDMIKRESKEIQAFMDKNGFTTINDLPSDLKMGENQFYEIKNEAGKGVGVWINVIKAGDPKDMAVSEKTHILARFAYEAIGNRMHGGLTKFSNIGPSDTDIPGVTFTYLANINPDLQQSPFTPAPHSTSSEEKMQPFICNAMMLALGKVPVGSTIKMITSFREGPAFTLQKSGSFADENEVGVALYYSQLKFSYKR